MISFPLRRATTRIAAAGIAIAGLTLGPPASAQLPSASAAALGMADNYTAVARGFNAVAWNPAALAMPGSPRFSMTLLPLRGSAGFGPITLADVNEYDSVLLPDIVKDEWLRRIIDNGGEHGTAGGDVTFIGMSVGRFGLQVSSASQISATLSPDAAELLLYGNGSRESGAGFDLANSSFHGMLTTTAAVSFAQELPIRFLLPFADQHVGIGVTVKYTVGNGLVQGRNVGSSVPGTAGDIDVAFPIIQSDTEASARSLDRGRGFGVDVGAAWTGGPLSVAAAIQNVVNTFAWDTAGFVYRPGRVRFDGENRDADFDLEAYAGAPAEIRQAVSEFGFGPKIVVGASWQVGRALLLAADLRHEIGKDRELGPRSHLGAGAELRMIPMLPLRAGLSAVTGGYQLGAGAGLELGRVNLAASIGRRATDFGSDQMAAVELTFGAR